MEGGVDIDLFVWGWEGGDWASCLLSGIGEVQVPEREGSRGRKYF